MAVLFNGTNAANGFDSLGHYVRDELLVSDCTGYAIIPVPGCSAKFSNGRRGRADASNATRGRGVARDQSVLSTGDGRRPARRWRARRRRR